MANDYTWQELFRRLGLEARPQTGYYYKPEPNPFGVPNNTFIFKNKPIVDAKQLKDIGTIGFPNRDLLLSPGGFDKQSKFVQDLLARRNPLTKHLKNISPFLESKNMMWDFPGAIAPIDTPLNKEAYLVENEYLHKPTKYKIPSQTLKMMGDKIGSAPLTKGLARAYVIGAPVAMMVEDTMRENEWREYNKFRRLRDMVGDIMLRDNSNLQWRQGE